MLIHGFFMILVIDKKTLSASKVSELDDKRRNAWMARQEELNRKALAKKMVADVKSVKDKKDEEMLGKSDQAASS